MCQTFWETDSLGFSVFISATKRSLRHHAVIDEIIIDAIQRSPGVTTRSLSKRVGCSHSIVWRTLN